MGHALRMTEAQLNEILKRSHCRRVRLEGKEPAKSVQSLKSTKKYDNEMRLKQA